MCVVHAGRCVHISAGAQGLRGTGFTWSPRADVTKDAKLSDMVLGMELGSSGSSGRAQVLLTDKPSLQSQRAEVLSLSLIDALLGP